MACSKRKKFARHELKNAKEELTRKEIVCKVVVVSLLGSVVVMTATPEK
jgi:hypothetical protein